MIFYIFKHLRNYFRVKFHIIYSIWIIFRFLSFSSLVNPEKYLNRLVDRAQWRSLWDAFGKLEADDYDIYSPILYGNLNTYLHLLALNL